MTAPAFAEKTLPQMLAANAITHAARTAIRQKDFGIWKPLTWAEYFDRASAVGMGLRALGLAPGGHVAIISENRVEWVLGQLGAGLVGGITVGVYPTSPANEVAYVVGHSDSEIVICEDQEQVEKVLERQAELPKVRRVVVMETKGARSYPPDLVLTFAALEEMGRAYAIDHAGLINDVLHHQSLDDIALVVYTSGSTGKPKGAMLSYRNLRAEAVAVAERYDITAADSHLSYLPLCHVAEQFMTTMTPIYAGSLVNFGESIRTVQEDLREVAPTMFLGVPRIWEKLHSAILIKLTEAGGIRLKLFERAFAACAPFAEVPVRERTARQKLIFRFWYWLVFRALQNFIGLRRARLAMTGAAPIPARIVSFFRTLGVPLVEVYGATETSGMVTGQRVGEIVPTCVGPATCNSEIRLGDHGEVQVKGDLVFVGYYKNEEATHAGRTADGWLRTGDVAEIVSGQFRIVDRLKDIMITAGGKNLSPSEIENTVKASRYIKECIVIGDARKFVSALIQIDPETVGQWAEGKGIAYTHFRSLAENREVRDLIDREITAANATLAQVSHIRKFHLLTKELDHDDDEVTATMKVRRSNIQAKYAAEIEGLYRGG
jgi:long-chain acyl-CoA synthetase